MIRTTSPKLLPVYHAKGASVNLSDKQDKQGQPRIAGAMSTDWSLQTQDLGLISNAAFEQESR